MVNVEIFAGLRGALERGESLKRAMMTFYNAGYKKEEISEAAGLLKNYHPGTLQEKPIIQEEKQVKPKLDQPTLIPLIKKKKEKPKQPFTEQETKQEFEQPVLQPVQQPQPAQPVPNQPAPRGFAQQFPAQAYYIYPTHAQPPQQYSPKGVSNYPPEPKKNRTIVYVLLFLLFLLVGLLATIFIFREELVNLVSNMFSG